jgi:hypothetical protein
MKKPIKQSTTPEPHQENCQCTYCIPIINDPTIAPDFEPLDGSLIANEIARRAQKDREMRALEEREHEKGFFDMPIST